MLRFASFALCSVSVFLSACTVVTNAPPPESAPQPAPASGPAAPRTVVRPDADGRPANLKPGQNEAFWIWRGSHGDWHLRTTTAGIKHRFNGHIDGHGSEITGVQAAKTEHNDKVQFKDGKIHFDFSTDGNEDGIDFNITGKACVDFDLAIDGQPRPDRVVVGVKEQRPTVARFTTCSQ